MIRWAGMEILDSTEELVDPKHTVLLMWDFAQNIVANTFNRESLLRNAAALVKAAREHRVPIIYSRQNNMRIVGDTGAPTVRMRFRRGGKPLSELAKQPEPHGFPPVPEIAKEVAPQEGDIIFEKFCPNAFLGTCFEWWLRKLGTKTILVGGVNLATGVNATAREAINLGYYGIVIRDCASTGSEEDYRVAIAATERVVDVFDSTEIIQAWNSRRAGK